MDISKIKKYEDLSFAQWIAFANKIGDLDVVKKTLQGKKTIKVEDAIQSLFDKHGRRIPDNLQANVCDASKNYKLNHPKLSEKVDFADRILRLHESLGINTGITAEKLNSYTQILLAIIKENPQIANITNGVCLPIILPKFATDNLESELELYLAVFNKNYTKTFDYRKFHNHRETLTNKVNITQMKEGPVIGLHFPNPLQGFSINASKEQMSTLPEGFILSGMDTFIAMIMYPDILARDWNTPGLDIAVYADYSLNLWASDVISNDMDSLSNARSNCSSSLLFLG